MKNYILGIFLLFSLLGCVTITPNYTQPQFEIERYNPVEKWISVENASVKNAVDGDEIFQLKGGMRVFVFKYDENWALISPSLEKQHWVDVNQLCDFEGCYIKPKNNSISNAKLIKPTVKQTSTSSKSVANISQKMSSTSASSNKSNAGGTYNRTNSSSCACSSKTYCVGPRGGHYCITSGGNKRYLPR